MRQYTVQNLLGKPILWEKIDTLVIDQFPWYQGGLKQSTQVQMAISEGNICLKVHCEDQHSSAQITEFNGSVYLDSCFEFFLIPRDELGSAYLNFEINCCKTLHLAYGKDLLHRTLATPQQGQRVLIESSIEGAIKTEQKADQYWTLYIEIPIDLIEELVQHRVVDTAWYGNFYRCGGKTNAQYACWQPIVKEQPAFHEPLQFGKLIILNNI